MSVAVSLERLRSEVARFGPDCYLVTVTADGRPHCVSVSTTWSADDLLLPAGRTSLANAAERPQVTLLWAAPSQDAYSLIVDGTASADGDAVRVRPRRAVLHRRRAASADDGHRNSECVTVLAPSEDATDPRRAT